jgi:hypothetical protein
MTFSSTSGNSRSEGERRKQATLDKLEVIRRIYVRRGRRALLMKLLRDGTATADDVRAAIKLPPGIDPRCLGCVPVALAQARIIRIAGFTRSGRAERNRCTTAVWAIADLAAAVQWLAANPDVPDPPEAGGQRSLWDL